MRFQTRFLSLLGTLLIFFCAKTWANDYPYQVGARDPNCGYVLFFHWGDHHMEEMLNEKLFVPTRQEFFIKHARCKNSLYFASDPLSTKNFGPHLLCVYVPKTLAIAKQWTTGLYAAMGKAEFDQLHFSFFVPDAALGLIYTHESLKAQMARYPKRRAFKHSLSHQIAHAQDFEPLLLEFKSVLSSASKNPLEFHHEKCTYQAPLAPAEKLSLARDVILELVQNYNFGVLDQRKKYNNFLRESSDLLGIAFAFDRDGIQFILLKTPILSEEAAHELFDATKIYPSLEQIINNIFDKKLVNRNFILDNINTIEQNIEEDYKKELEHLFSLFSPSDFMALENRNFVLSNNIRSQAIPLKKRMALLSEALISTFPLFWGNFEKEDDKLFLQGLIRKLNIYHNIIEKHETIISTDYLVHLMALLENADSAFRFQEVFMQDYVFLSHARKCQIWHENRYEIFKEYTNSCKRDGKESLKKACAKEELQRIKALKKIIKNGEKILSNYKKI